MKTKIQKILLALFSICAIAILFVLFPIVVCPMMWMLFLFGIIVQFVWFKEFIIFFRIATSGLFFLIAFRIYNDFVNDFSINPETSLGVKFLLLGILYGIGSLLAIRISKVVVHILTTGILVATVMTSFLIVQETHTKVTDTFQKENPDYILLDNQETRWALKILEKEYAKIGTKSGMAYHTSKDTLNGNYYSFIVCDGTADGTAPLLSFKSIKADSTEAFDILFRYEPDLKYGYFRYTQILPDTLVIKDEDEATNYFKNGLELLDEIVKK